MNIYLLFIYLFPRFFASPRWPSGNPGGSQSTLASALSFPRAPLVPRIKVNRKNQQAGNGNDHGESSTGKGPVDDPPAADPVLAVESVVTTWTVGCPAAEERRRALLALVTCDATYADADAFVAPRSDVSDSIAGGSETQSALASAPGTTKLIIAAMPDAAMSSSTADLRTGGSGAQKHNTTAFASTSNLSAAADSLGGGNGGDGDDGGGDGGAPQGDGDGDDGGDDGAAHGAPVCAVGTMPRVTVLLRELLEALPPVFVGRGCAAVGAIVATSRRPDAEPMHRQRVRGRAAAPGSRSIDVDRLRMVLTNRFGVIYVLCFFFFCFFFFFFAGVVAHS
jgi:hypothetical protein